MEYKVSEKVQKKFDTLTKDAKVQKALQFMEEDQDTVIDKQIELTLIPGSRQTMSRRKLRDFLEMFKEEGLTDCHIDEYGQLRWYPERYWRRKDSPCGRPHGYGIPA